MVLFENPSENSAFLKGLYLTDCFAWTGKVDVSRDAKPLVEISSVLGHEGWVFGYQSVVNTDGWKFDKTNFAMGFTSGDFVFHTTV